MINRGFFMVYMKRRLLISFIAVVLLILLMRWQGSALVTPVSPKGIIDVEFARTEGRWQQLLLFLDLQALRINLYLDLLFIVSYVWFLLTACQYIQSKTAWRRATAVFKTVALTAGVLDVLENFMILLVLENRIAPDVLQTVFYIAAAKFALAGVTILYLLFSWPFALRRKY